VLVQQLPASANLVRHSAPLLPGSLGHRCDALGVWVLLHVLRPELSQEGEERGEAALGLAGASGLLALAGGLELGVGVGLAHGGGRGVGLCGGLGLQWLAGSGDESEEERGIGWCVLVGWGKGNSYKGS
jgi:hypothetical protein